MSIFILLIASGWHSAPSLWNAPGSPTAPANMLGLRHSSVWQTCLLIIAFFQIFFLAVSAKDTLKICSFSECLENADIIINNVDMEYDADIRGIKFDVTGTSSTSQNVTVSLKVEAYGKDVYHISFNPCDPATFVAGLCPGIRVLSIIFRTFKANQV